eukprot:2267646-Prymnesium_polylepis.1
MSGPTLAPTLKAVGRLQRLTSGRPANSIGDGARVGILRKRDHGVTHAAMSETMECARDHGVYTLLGGRGGRRSGLRDRREERGKEGSEKREARGERGVEEGG